MPRKMLHSLLPAGLTPIQVSLEQGCQNVALLVEAEHLGAAKRQDEPLQIAVGKRTLGRVCDVLGMDNVYIGSPEGLLDRNSGTDEGCPVERHCGECSRPQDSGAESASSKGCFDVGVMSRQRVVFRVAHLSRVRGEQDDPPGTCTFCTVDEFLDSGRFRVEEDVVDVRQCLVEGFWHG